ncbi:MAG: PadR family transcriptional regulator [Candidatus Izemoplasmatales bacterium]|jgi:PadR family transcriptional regulator PadR|nr:PadR family transcriptional regulator [Candidatus Izemoplasmatales bacterium]MDD4355276.1 PadR family transcriptional regulator [Candidatus Izemoplasmatales bacterium]MDD4987971.1 PadR family transcriptional regulator [Candidatus Izemoplasmatales bacterium]MDD5602005.1 PadR family transcriptional regulator [Candidatus Izemoplasmatales bacterium]MDY0373160.1 PadR family transcriptional regulator [Candidatus Izemoplasmatales bacterium]
MDAQLKKGFLELLVLAAIKYEDSYGYKIIQDVSEVVDISESTMYPILRRLEQQKLVVTYNTEFNSRIRKYFCITPSGKERLMEAAREFQELKQLYDYILR